MRLDAGAVRHAAALARLDVDESAARRIAEDLSRMLTGIGALAGEEDAGVEPMGAVPRRDDVPGPSAGTDAGTGRVPRVVGADE